MESNTICPVCTLYLRPGITLKAHLSSHPKQKVIEALVRLSNTDKDLTILNNQNSPNLETAPPANYGAPSNTQMWNQNSPLPVNVLPPNFGGMQGNHSFIYQQFMSTSSQQPSVINMNPLNQQYVTIPTVFNPPMMGPPYMYQQQQVIMSSGGQSAPSVISKPLSIELPLHTPLISPATDQSPSPVSLASVPRPFNTLDDDRDEPELVIIRSGPTPIRDCQNAGYEQQHKDDVFEEKAESPSCSPVPLTKENVRKHDDVEDEITQTIDDDAEHKKFEEFQDHEENWGSPKSNTSSDFHLRVRTDLSKACQTQQESPSIITLENLENPPDYYITEPASTASDVVPNQFGESESTYTMANSTVIQPSDQVNVIDMDGMQLVLCNDFMNNHLISQVDDFDCMSNRSERRVLMNLGTMECSRNGFSDRDPIEILREESMSHESANIRADEHMPPRGELSGQESNAASDIAWTNQMQYHRASPGASSSCDLLARETWETSDCSDSEVPPLLSRILPVHVPESPDIDDAPTIISVTEPPLNFKCSTCGEGFKCPKERKAHQNERHKHAANQIRTTGKINTVGAKLGIRKVKKLVIKPKKTEIKSENNFDNLKFKLEVEEEVAVKPSLPKYETEDTDTGKNDIAYSICTICDKPFSTLKDLKQHKLEVHGKIYERHRCNICDEIFPNDYKYTEHLKLHPLECRLCGKYFYRRQNLQLHVKRHLGIKPYKCECCEKSFLTKQKHDEHKNVHTGDAPLKCNMCSETFRRHSNLIQHRNRHHLNIKPKIKDYICYCGDIFHSKKKLAWHKEIHDAKPKACTYCSEKFVHMSSLTRHMRRTHNERFVPKENRSDENVECPICKGIYLRNSLENHVRSHSGKRPYACAICNKDFTTKWNLKLHRWTHASRTSKPFKCDQCKGAFIRETDYTAHMNSHKSVRPYTCNYCGAQFIRKSNCQRHVKEHEKKKMFSCQICNKTFHRSYYLKDHMRIHSGVRPFSCHICGKTSTTKSNHNKHVRIHHAREPVSTEN